MKNYFLNLILIISIIIQFSNSQQLPSTQLDLATQILKDCYGFDPSTVTDPCDMSKYNFTFNCFGDTISGITLNPTSKICELGDISAFPDISSIQVLGDNVLNSNFFSIWTSLTKLSSLSIDSVSFSLPNNSIPSSLTKLTIGQLGVPFGKNFFQGKITQMVINQVVNGGSLPSSLDTENSALTQLTLPVNQYSFPPSNINQFLKSLLRYILNVYNEKSTAGYQDYSFPTIKKPFNSLDFVNIKFINNGYKTTAQTFEIDSDLGFNTLGLTITGIGFTMPSSGVMNATLNRTPSFKFIVSETCGIVTGCPNNECILLPPGGSFEPYNCPLSTTTTTTSTTTTSTNSQGNDDGTGASSASILNCSMFLLMFLIICCLI